MSADTDALSRKLGDRYLIERELGRGGMGAVYLARDRRLDRLLALKVLPPEYAAEPDLRERFLRETRLAAGFSHPNIVPVFAIEDGDGLLAFSMGYEEGESLSSLVARNGPLSRRDAVRLLQDVSYALAYAHGRGVVHRDIKPDNIMIERATGRALVMDFGIARAITPVTDRPGLTRVGEVVGTPEYMSPEQAAGDQIDGRADLYSMGLVAWFALTGRTAITGESTQRILVKQLTEPIPPLATQRADLPQAFCDVVDRCCAKEADDRFPTAEAVVEALDATQLATPEVPVAFRLLAPEMTAAATKGLTAALLLPLGAAMVASNGNGNVFAIAVIVAAMAVVQCVGALRDVRRLHGSGYSSGDIHRLLSVTLTERDDERAARATDTALVVRRRRRVRLSVAMLCVLAGIVIWLRFTGETSLHGTVPLLLFFAALLGTAAAIAVLLGSPFRRSIGERLFNRLWLGRVGRALIARAGAQSGVTSNSPVPAPASRQVTLVGGTDTRARSSARASDDSALAALASDVRALHTRLDALIESLATREPTR